MKTSKRLLFLLPVMMVFSMAFLPSCTTLQSTNNDDLVTPVASIATGVVLSKANSMSVRMDTAAKLNQIADGILTLTEEDATGADVAALVMAYSGGKPEYAPYAASLSLIFDRSIQRLGRSRAADISRKIADGILFTTAPYL